MAAIIPNCRSFLANGIGAEGLAIFGCVYFVLPALVVITVEWATIHAIVRRQRAWPTGAVVAANFWSLLAGIPVMILFARNFDRLVPSDLHLYFPAYVRFSLMKYAAYFAVTVVAELAYVMWLARRERAWSSARLAGAVLLANALTYAVLCPVHYFGMRPTHDVRTFTADTSWAPSGLGPIIYIDYPTRSLMRIDADGANRTTLIDDPMDGFLLTRNLKTCLYLHGRKLHYQRIGEPESRRLLDGRTPENRDSPLGMADLSPSGERVAYLSETGELVVVDLRLERTVQAGIVARPRSFDVPEVCWTSKEDVLCVTTESEGNWLVTVKDDLTCNVLSLQTLPPQTLAGTYASRHDRYSIVTSHGQNRAEDHRQDLHAAVFSVLANNHAIVTRRGLWNDDGHERLLKISDNPGIWAISGHRTFDDISFLPDSDLAVLSDGTFHALYLLDAAEGRVGKLTAGGQFIVPIPKYRKMTPAMRVEEAMRLRQLE